MKLICPGCGLIASAEAMANDAACRETLQAVAGLPAPLPPLALQYLSLFRPEKTALSWTKAARIARELAALVAGGHVQVDKKAARPCPARLWAQAIEEMLGRRERLERPLKNHNYLRAVTYGLADQADAQAEKRVREAEQSGSYRRKVDAVDDEDGVDRWATMPDQEWELLPAVIRQANAHKRVRG